VPSQTIPVASETSNSPLISDYNIYNQNGYSFMQNLIANMVLRETTIDSATISMMAVPVPAEELVSD
jgi:hypothetical protein